MADKEYEYAEIYHDHMEIARKRFVERIGREPTLDELIQEHERLFYFFYN